MTEALTEPALFELLSLECRACGDGSVRYYGSLGQLHRVYGPAIEYSDGGSEWLQNGRLHRIDGPANVRPNDYQAWHQNGLLHRLDGPAIECIDGFRSWFQNGLRHRIDGPAVEYADGFCEWYIKGRELTETAWQQAVASMVNNV